MTDKPKTTIEQADRCEDAAKALRELAAENYLRVRREACEWFIEKYRNKKVRPGYDDAVRELELIKVVSALLRKIVSGGNVPFWIVSAATDPPPKGGTKADGFWWFKEREDAVAAVLEAVT